MPLGNFDSHKLTRNLKMRLSPTSGWFATEGIILIDRYYINDQIHLW